MNLYISAAEYDYHTLLKVAEMAGLAGIIGFHEAGDGYLITFPDGESTEALINDYKGRLRDLEHLDALMQPCKSEFVREFRWYLKKLIEVFGNGMSILNITLRIYLAHTA